MAKDELAEIPWLASCTTRERDAIRRRADVITVPAGTQLTHEGDVARWFYAVVDGRATASRDGRTVARFTAGDPVNELEVVRNGQESATVVAETDLTIMAMGRRQFLSALDDTPGLARRLLLPHVPEVAGARSRAGRPALVPLSVA